MLVWGAINFEFGVSSEKRCGSDDNNLEVGHGGTERGTEGGSGEVIASGSVQGEYGAGWERSSTRARIEKARTDRERGSTSDADCQLELVHLGHGGEEGGYGEVNKGGSVQGDRGERSSTRGELENNKLGKIGATSHGGGVGLELLHGGLQEATGAKLNRQPFRQSETSNLEFLGIIGHGEGEGGSGEVNKCGLVQGGGEEGREQRSTGRTSIEDRGQHLAESREKV